MHEPYNPAHVAAYMQMDDRIRVCAHISPRDYICALATARGQIALSSKGWVDIMCPGCTRAETSHEQAVLRAFQLLGTEPN